MFFIVLLLVGIFALAAASPVPLGQLFASDFNDPGDSPYTETLLDPLSGGAMMDTNDLFSSSASSNPSDLLYTETMPGDMAAAGQATVLSEPDSFNQVNYPVENDLFGQLNQGEADSDCIPDVIQGIGKIRLGRSCSGLKEDKKSEQVTCMKQRSLCCCSGRGLGGVYDAGCEPRTHPSYST